jgi:hypothetical protein
VKTVASAPDFVLPIAFLGVLFCCLWRGPLRWLGLPLAASVMLWPRAPTPDLWIGDGGTNAAFVEAGQAVVMRPAVRQFAVDVWTRRRGLEPAERCPHLVGHPVQSRCRGQDGVQPGLGRVLQNGVETIRPAPRQTEQIGRGGKHRGQGRPGPRQLIAPATRRGGRVQLLVGPIGGLRLDDRAAGCQPRA